MSHNNDQIEINTPLTKEDITQIVNSETIQQAIKDSHDAWEKTKFKWQIFVALIMALSAAFGYYLKWDSDRKDRIEQQIQVANERKAEQIQARINLKMEWMRKANSAVMEMREIHETIIRKCLYHNPRNLYKENIARMNAEFDVARAFDGIRFIFDNNIQERFNQLNKFDESITDVCAKNTPTDDVWRKYQFELNNLMGESIDADKQELNKFK